MPETVVHFQIRMNPAIHDVLASMAKEQKLSLNALIVGILTKATNGDLVASKTEFNS